MTEDEKKRHLAGAIRNNMGAATIFTPFPDLNLTYRDEMLCTITLGPQHATHAIASMWDLHDLDDDALWQVVMEGKPVPSQAQEEPAPDTTEKPKARGNKKR